VTEPSPKHAARHRRDVRRDHQPRHRARPRRRASGVALSAATAAAVVTLTALPSPAVAAPAAPHGRRAPVSAPLSALELEVLASVNVERRRRGLVALRTGRLLQFSAHRYSDDLSRGQVLRHDVRRMTRLLVATRHRVIRENLAAVPEGSPLGAAAFRLWLASPTHRAALLDPAVRAVGVGVVDRGGLRYVTLDLTD